MTNSGESSLPSSPKDDVTLIVNELSIGPFSHTIVRLIKLSMLLVSISAALHVRGLVDNKVAVKGPSTKPVVPGVLVFANTAPSLRERRGGAHQSIRSSAYIRYPFSWAAKKSLSNIQARC